MKLKNPNRWIRNEHRRWTSLLKRFREEKKTDEHFELMLNNINLEDLIALKLELTAKTAGSPLYGQPIYESLKLIVQDAVIKFAISTTQTTSEAASFLGITQKTLFAKTKKYNLWNYFDPTYLRKRENVMKLWRMRTQKGKQDGTQTESSGNSESGSEGEAKN